MDYKQEIIRIIKNYYNQLIENESASGREISAIEFKQELEDIIKEINWLYEANQYAIEHQNMA
jgi:hypothetical protein